MTARLTALLAGAAVAERAPRARMAVTHMIESILIVGSLKAEERLGKFGLFANCCLFELLCWSRLRKRLAARSLYLGQDFSGPS
jgi:hypothetical protein